MIEIKHLSKTFQMKDGAVNALKDISLTIPDGSIYGIIGMSGAGKSTLVRCINLLERPTEGSVVIDGVEMEKLSPAELRAPPGYHHDLPAVQPADAAQLPEEHLLPHGAGRGEKGRKPKSVPESCWRWWACPTRPTPTRHSCPAARSSASPLPVRWPRTPSLLCDEATSALDPNTTHAILTLIKDINKKLGITVVVITHQMSVVEEICDHVAILDGGVVVEVGYVKEIFSNPKTAAARRLVAPNGGSAAPGSVELCARRPCGARDLQRFVRRKAAGGEPRRRKGILVSVLSADTRDLSGQCYGSMLLKLPADVEQAKQAAAYMRAQPGITVEEVTGE